ncbi:MAG: hypothetical protein ABIQ44_10940, partial [Chloroflexia bacterium]
GRILQVAISVEARLHSGDALGVGMFVQNKRLSRDEAQIGHIDSFGQAGRHRLEYCVILTAYFRLAATSNGGLDIVPYSNR